MKRNLLPLVLIILVSGCHETLTPGEEIRFQLPIMVWNDQYVVDRSELRISGVFCKWPDDRCNVILADQQYEMRTGKWTNAALVEIKRPGIRSAEPVPYDVSKNECLTDPLLKDLPCSPNFVVKALGKPNDTLYKDILPTIAQIRAKRWLNYDRPEGPVIAIIDTGIDYNHEDLSGKVISGYNAILDREDSYQDDNGHGTHCASVVASHRNNGVGISGLCHNCRLQAVKFLSSNGSGSLFHAIKAIDWAANHGARILSNSWGGGGYSEPLRQAIKRAKDKGILFVGAAGNEGDDEANYPALYDEDNVVSVAAIDASDKLASFSNYGAATVDIGAPGVSILAARMGGGYVRLSGTSMATPFVAAAMGAVLTKYPSASYQEVIQRTKRVRKLKRFKDKLSTSGILNLTKALRNENQ